MNTARKLKITDVQTDNGKTEKVEMSTQCIFNGTPEDYTIDFDEIFAENMKSHTTVHVTGGKSVDLIRQGAIDTEMIIETNKRHNCVYSTPYGDIMMGIQASEVVSHVHENSVYLRMSYKIDYYGNVAQDKRMILEVGGEIQENENKDSEIKDNEKNEKDGNE